MKTSIVTLQKIKSLSVSLAISYLIGFGAFALAVVLWNQFEVLFTLSETLVFGNAVGLSISVPFTIWKLLFE